jgi:hypothetical protein
MALQTEIWVTEIQENLFPANDFMSRCKDHSAFINHLTVHLPQSGANPAVFKNNTSLPVSINQRTDTDFTYSLNNYKGEPLLITNLEELQNSYDKRSSVLGNITRNMGYAIANQTLYSWAPSGASRIVRTSGSAVSTALAPSATGTRNAITLLDIAALKAKLDNDNVPQEGRMLVMPADMYNNQLLQINNIQAFYAYNMPVTQTGKVPTIFGFEVMIRPTVLVYDTSAVIKSIGDSGVPSSPATTDNLACIAYHPDFVSKAQGGINVYANENRAEYYGSILSIEVQHGASALRPTAVGIAALVQQ